MDKRHKSMLNKIICQYKSPILKASELLTCNII